MSDGKLALADRLRVYAAIGQAQTFTMSPAELRELAELVEAIEFLKARERTLKALHERAERNVHAANVAVGLVAVAGVITTLVLILRAVLA